MPIPEGDWIQEEDEHEGDVRFLSREHPASVAAYRLNGDPEILTHQGGARVLGPGGSVDVFAGLFFFDDFFRPALGADLTRTETPALFLVDTIFSNLPDMEGEGPCPPSSRFGEAIPSEDQRLFLGAASPQLRQFSRVHQDGQDPVFGRIRTRGLAPAGAGGECIFTNLYLAIRSSTVGVVKVTPILDGARMEDAARDILVMALGEEQILKRYEIGLSVPLLVGGSEVSRQAMRGTWLAIEIDAIDLLGCGPFMLEGVELEYEPVTESHPGRVFTQEPTEEYPPINEHAPLYIGTSQPDLLIWGEGKTDNGAPVLPRLQTAPLAPAGAGGEAIFTNLYVTVTRSNREAVTLRLTPIVDGELLPVLDVELEGVDSKVSEAHEIGLHVPLMLGGIPFGAQAVRGTWLQARLELLDGVDEGVFTFDGVELEYETVTESEDPVDA